MYSCQNNKHLGKNLTHGLNSLMKWLIENCLSRQFKNIVKIRQFESKQKVILKYTFLEIECYHYTDVSTVGPIPIFIF